jgi:hypothetical protein
MGRKCTICSHEDSEKINKDLIGGMPYRSIADRYKISKSALIRHREKHLPGSLIKAKRIEEVTQADSIIERLINLTNETMDIYREVKKAKDYDLALKALARAEKQAELQARLLGELKQESTINIALMPGWTQVREVILQSFHDCPDKLLSLTEALDELEV